MMYFGDSRYDDLLLESKGSDSKLEIIYTHMLKYECQTNKQSKSWLKSIFNNRKAISEEANSTNKIIDIRKDNEKILNRAIERAKRETLNSVVIGPHDPSIYNIDFVLKKGNVEEFCRKYYDSQGADFGLEAIDYYTKNFDYNENKKLF